MLHITTMGLIAGLALSVIALFFILKDEDDRKEWNRTHKRHPNPKQSMYKKHMIYYFALWIIGSLVGWYYLHIIELGQFFLIAVILPAVVSAGLREAR